MEIHQSALDHRHQDMLENTTNTCSSDLDILNQDLQQTHEVNDRQRERPHSPIEILFREHPMLND